MLLPRSFTARSGGRLRTAGGALALAAALALTACGQQDEASLMASAKAALDRKDYLGAQAPLKELLQAKPNVGEARLLLGKALAGVGEAANAEAEFRRALENGVSEAAVATDMVAVMVAQNKGPAALARYGQSKLADAQEDAMLKVRLAEAEAVAGNFEGALARLEDALRQVPNHPQAMLLAARIQVRKGDMAAAGARVDQVVAQNPKLADALLMQADLVAQKTPPKPGVDTTAVVAAYRKVLEADPKHVPAHVALVNVHLLQGRTEDAQKQWEALKQVAPDNGQTAFLEAVLADLKGNDKRVRELTQLLLRGAPNNPRLLLLAGKAEARLGANEQAEQLYTKAVAAAPQAALPRRLLAQVQLRSGQADKAMATLKPLLEANPPDPESLSLSAQAHLLKGNTQAAEAALARVSKLKPDNTKVRTAMALLNLSKGQDAAAERELATLAGSDKGTSADLALVTARLRANDLPGALKAVDGLAAKLPNDPMPEHLRGRIALSRKDKTAARTHFTQSLNSNPDYMPSLSALAALDLADGKPDDAKARFNAVLQRNPKHTGAMLALAELHLRTGSQHDKAVEWMRKAVQTDPSDAGLRLRLIDHLTTVGEHKQALEVVQAGLVTTPDAPDLLLRSGRLQLLMGQAQQAVTTFSRLVQISPQSAPAQLMLADAQSAAGNRSGVNTAVARAAELAPDSVEVLQAQFQQAQRDGKPDQALAVARRAQAKHPKLGLGWAQEGSLEAARKNWPAAVAALRKAVAASQPGDSVQRLHAALLSSGATAEATRLADDWRKQHPEDLGFMKHLGDQALTSGNLALAEALYVDLLRKAPTHVPALNNLAYVMARQKKPGAVATAERALALAPQSLELKDTLALALASEGQLDKARELQTEIVAAAPDKPLFRLQLVRLLLEANDRPAARTEIKPLERLGEGFARHAEVQELLKKAEGR